MALLAAYQSGNWSSTSTWAKLISSATLSTSSLQMLSSNTFYSYTLTAANLTDAWRGVLIPFNSSSNGVSFTATLQEYNGLSWSDTVANSTFYVQSDSAGRRRWFYCPFGSSYTPTTTSTGYYRVKLVFASGTITQYLFGASSTFSCHILSASPTAVPTAGDDIIIAGDATKADGTTNNITVTIDADATVGSGTAVATFPYLSGNHNAVTICTGGRLKAHRTNDFTFKFNLSLTQNVFYSQLDFGTVADPVTGDVTILSDTSVSSSLSPYRGVRYYGSQDTTTPYYSTFAGVQKSYISTTYDSGVGTTASPFITTDPVDWSVGDQVCIVGTNGSTSTAHTAPTSAVYVSATGYTRQYLEMTFASAHSFRVGDRMTLAGWSPSSYNATFEVADVPTSTTLRINALHSVASGNPITIGTVTLKNDQTEYRYIKTKNSSTSYVFCTIPAGAEDGLQYTHLAGCDVNNLSSNLKIIPTWAYNANNQITWTADSLNVGVATDSYTPLLYDSVRFEYPGGSGAYSLGILGNGYTSGSCSATINKIVLYGPRNWVIYDNVTTHASWSIKNIVVAGFFTGTSLITLTGYNKVIENMSITDQYSILSDGGRNIWRNVRIWNTNPLKTGAGYGCQLQTTSVGSQFINCNIQGGGGSGTNYGVRTLGATNFIFSNCEIGTIIVNNTADVQCDSNVYTTGLFDNCTFGSSTLINNYTNTVDGTTIRFHKYQATDNNHRWYTKRGKAISTASGLSDTTVKTAGSVNVRIDPENATDGFIWEFKIPSIVAQQTFFNGFLQKNASFGTSVAKVELWLPGSDTTGTADSSWTADNTTGSYQAFNISKNYLGTTDALATIRVTAITNTAGAYIYLADFYNSQGALNLWDSAQPVSPVVPTNFSAVPGLVWSYPDSNTATNTMGQRQVGVWDEALSSHTTAGTAGKVLADAEANTDVTQAKVDTL